MDIPEFPLPPQHQPKPEPPAGNADVSRDEKQQSQQAADMIRQKLHTLYNVEPSAKAEVKEVVQQGPSSIHQEYIQKLSRSGKSIAEIQTAWHDYYQNLSDTAKSEVWEEFYAQGHHSRSIAPHQPSTNNKDVTTVSMPPPEGTGTKTSGKHNRLHHYKKTVADYKQEIVRHSKTKQKLTAKHHFQSLLFGVGVGSLAVLLLLFGFFNERFLAPFITPSRHVNSTPIITDPSSKTIGTDPEIIIPKINVEIPVVYNEPSIADGPMQKALERGVVHYASTPYPGQKGNTVIFGHSSNNIFNPGKYKFAFVLLSKLDNGDLFYLDKGGKRYVYKVYKKTIVQPTDLAVLGTADKPDTATLITCDPPGTSLNRLIVLGEQISPSPTKNVASTAAKADVQPKAIPSNAPSLWQRFVNWL